MVKSCDAAKSMHKCIRNMGKKAGGTAAGSSLDDAMTAASTEGLQDIVKVLTQEPHKILPCLKLVQSPQFGAGRASVSDKLAAHNEPWPDSYTQFKLIPKYWLWAWVQEVQVKFTPQVIEMVDAADKQAIRKLMLFATGRSDSSKVTALCLDKVILSRTLIAAYKNMGSRLGDEWFGSAVLPSGEIDWHGHGVYSLQKSGKNEEKQASHIGHVCGSKAFSISRVVYSCVCVSHMFVGILMRLLSLSSSLFPNQLLSP